MSEDNSNSSSKVPLLAYILPLPFIVGIVFCVLFVLYQQRKKRAMRLAAAQTGARTFNKGSFRIVEPTQHGQAASVPEFPIAAGRGQMMPVYGLPMSDQSIVYHQDGMHFSSPQGGMPVFNSHHGGGIGGQNLHMPTERHPSSPRHLHYGSPQTGMDGGVFRK